ncbi:unnamed protein product [Schistosoma margrebowiei]|uniref:Uncharacterized protein n=1 Tax=Schistosoma margrebowiei TaxID=48269 RepID=A0A183LNL8_9TREM|nr:unnamed protein product [Schistosoma margrebowiei]
MCFQQISYRRVNIPHKHIHKATWVSPDSTTENQIDHICITEKFRRLTEDVVTKRGDDIDSNHHLIVAAKMKVKLKNPLTTGQIALQKFSTAFLRHTEKLNKSKVTLNNKLQALQGSLKVEETTMKNKWKVIKEAVTSTCQEVLRCKNNGVKSESLLIFRLEFKKGRTRRQQLPTKE